jgi:hypothetical protein
MQRELAACVTRIARAVVPRRIRKGFYLALLDRRIEHLPSRRFIHQTLLPLLAGADCANLLFIGIQGYNRQIARTCRSLGLTLWTLDIDPAAVRWGAPGRHVIGDVRTLDQQIAPGFFDAAIMNGVLGYGVDDPQGAEAAIRALAAVVRPSGFVVIGWNPGRGADCRDIAATRELLIPAGLGSLPESLEFAPDTIQPRPHRYELYRVRQPSNT